MLIKNGILIEDLHTLHENYALHIENDRITETGVSQELEEKYSSDPVIRISRRLSSSTPRGR